MELLPLIGEKSLIAFRGYNAMLLGLKMLPIYEMEAYETFYARIGELPECEQESYLRQALAFVDVKSDEIQAMVSFAKDKNGVPYSPINVKNLPLK